MCHLKLLEVYTPSNISNDLPEPDVLDFPVSLLTASALLSGITITLTDQYKTEADFATWQHEREQRLSLKGLLGRCECRLDQNKENWEEREVREEEEHKGYMKRATKAAQDVSMDIRDLLQLKNVSTYQPMFIPNSLIRRLG